MVDRRLRVGVIFGGRSGEHEVSLQSARSVVHALDPLKYEIIQIGIDHTGKWLSGTDALDLFFTGQVNDLYSVFLLPFPDLGCLYRFSQEGGGSTLVADVQMDVVIPMLHGTFGEDGTLQGLFELADLAYVGAGVLGSALGMDKGIFKDVMRANHIPVLDSQIVLRNEIEHELNSVLEKAERLANYPLFVKPANLGSSVGVSKCTNRSDLVEGLVEAARYDRRVLIERGVQGREIEVSVLGNDHPLVSIPGEVIPSREFYSYEAKYIDGTSGLLIPAPLTKEAIKYIQEIAVRAYQLIDCAGMARVDFLLDQDARDEVAGIYLNEVNTIPGFTAISMYPKLWEASGLPYPALLDRLVELAIERKSERDRTEHRFHVENET